MIIGRLSRKISFDRRDLIAAFPALPQFVVNKIGNAERVVHAYPFSAPAVSPPVSSRSVAKKMMMIGRVSTTEPAINTVVGTSTLPDSWDRPRDTVQRPGRSTRNSSANRNSFQAIMNTNNPVDMIDGIASFRLI